MANTGVAAGDRFGPQGQLEVVSEPDSSHKVEVVCSTCNKDVELFGEKFIVRKYELTRGRLPCGCSSVPKWSKEQQLLRTRRKLEALRYELVGVVGEWKANSTKLSIKCDKGHGWETTTIARVLAGAQCPTCQDIARAIKHRQPDEQQIEQFMLSGKFLEGTKFTRSVESSGGVQGKFPYWDVECPVCKEDHYTKAGSCSGVFKALATNLTKGKLPCRCATSGYDSSKPGFVYVLRVEGMSDNFTGFGITGNPETRMRLHIKNLSNEGFSISEKVIFGTDGKLAQHIEKQFKANFVCRPQPVEGFRTEATSYDNFHLLVGEFENYEGETYGS